MICPILEFEKCMRSKCAWWSKENKACAVKVMAENGGYCCQPHAEYAVLSDDETDMDDRA